MKEYHNIKWEDGLIILILLFLLYSQDCAAYPNGFSPNRYREIVADAPWRISPSENAIPVLVFINDAYIGDVPCVGDTSGKCYLTYNFLRLNYVNISKSGSTLIYQSYDKNISNQNYGLIYNGSWMDIKYINVLPSERGTTVRIDVILNVSIFSCELSYPPDRCSINETLYKTSTFYVYVAEDSLPKISPGYYCGDTHLHTMYTDNWAPAGIKDYLTGTPANDLGEIGAPINFTLKAAKSVGLDWTMLTDHSEDYAGSFGQAKWQTEKSECQQYANITCIQGEEVSCRWGSTESWVGGKLVGSTVLSMFFEITPPGIALSLLKSIVEVPEGLRRSHFLAFGIPDLINGSSYGSGLLNLEHHCTELPQIVSSMGGVAYVAHPVDAQPVPNYWEIQMAWKEEAYNLSYLSGFEVWNTKEAVNETQAYYIDKDGLVVNKIKLEEGLKRYDKFLMTQDSQRKFIIAGSDAHGNLNTELARPMSCCYMDSPTKTNVLNALRNGKCILTSGPALKFTAKSSEKNTLPADMADTLSMFDNENLTLTLQWKSTQEFGGIQYAEFVKDGKLLLNYSNISEIDKFNSSRRYTENVSWGLHRQFYRAWVNTSKGERAYTNPIWVSVYPALKNHYFNLSFVVVNDALGNASSAFLVELWRGKRLTGVSLFNWTVSSLSPGESKTFSYKWLADVNGSVEFNAYADAANTTREVYEDDNTGYKSFLVTVKSFGQSLGLDSATLYEPYSVDVAANLVGVPSGGGGQYTIGKYVDYTANKPFRKSLIRIYYDRSQLNGIPEELFNVYSWSSSLSKWLPLDITYRNTTGNYLEAYTPHFSTFTAIGEARADLNVSRMVVSAGNVSQFSVVNLSATVRNDGVVDAGQVLVAFYGVQGYGIQEIYNTTLSGLAKGSSTVVSYSWNVGNNTGFLNVYAVAVLVNASEYRDFDNAAYGNLTVYEVLGGLPVASAGGPYVGYEGSIVFLNASGSYGRGSSLVSYLWDLDGNGLFDNAVGVVVNRTWSDDYFGVVGVNVTDGNGNSSVAYANVTVLNVPPTVDFSSDYWVRAYTPKQFAGSLTDPGNDSFTVFWGFGDGTSSSGPLCVNHTYSTAGLFTVRLNVSDDNGGAGFKERQVFVYVQDACRSGDLTAEGFMEAVPRC